MKNSKSNKSYLFKIVILFVLLILTVVSFLKSKTIYDSTSLNKDKIAQVKKELEGRYYSSGLVQAFDLDIDYKKVEGNYTPLVKGKIRVKNFDSDGELFLMFREKKDGNHDWKSVKMKKINHKEYYGETGVNGKYNYEFKAFGIDSKGQREERLTNQNVKEELARRFTISELTSDIGTDKLDVQFNLSNIDGLNIGKIKSAKFMINVNGESVGSFELNSHTAKKTIDDIDEVYNITYSFNQSELRNSSFNYVNDMNNYIDITATIEDEKGIIYDDIALGRI